MVTKMIPDTRANSEDSFNLQFISSGLIDSGEIALSQAKQEAINYSKEIFKMYKLVTAMLSMPNGSSKLLTLYDRVQVMKEDSEKAEEEIALFLRQISTTNLSSDGDHLSMSIFRMIDEMESIAVSIQHISFSIKRKSDLRIVFDDKMMHDIKKMIVLTNAILSHMVASIEKENATEALINKAYNIEDEINNYRNMLRKSVIEKIDRRQIEFQHATLFMEIIKECERIGDYVVNVLTSLPRE